MTVIDVATIILLLLALVHGFFRGLLRPLFTWVFVAVGVVVAFFHPGLAAELAPNATLRPLIGIVVVVAIALVGGLIGRRLAPLFYRRIPLLGSIDRLGGMFVSVLAALFSIFMMLNSLITVDTALNPLTRSDHTSAVQISEIRQLLEEHPELASLINSDDLIAAQQQLGTTGTVRSADIGKISGVLAGWQQVHNQLAASRIAPRIFSIFDHLPLIGHNRGWPEP